MTQIAVVTGASSGVGQAVAVKLAQRGWHVAAVARRLAELQQTAELAAKAGAKHAVSLHPCDIADCTAVSAMASEVFSRHGAVHALVNSAGTNTRDRSLRTLSTETWRRVMGVNIDGAYYCTQAFLPAMRQQGGGTIVNIVSDAAVAASAKAGAAYVASKFAMRGLTQSINAEERAGGIRATAILPGDIDTPLLENRPTPPTAEARKLMLQPEDVAECAVLAIALPPRAIIEELLIRPR
jgi:NAD(P)-dependent dehydrogenase (short-subunit alcohol dehydrogenase family)